MVGVERERNLILIITL